MTSLIATSLTAHAKWGLSGLTPTAWSAGLNHSPPGLDPALLVGGTLFVVSDTLLAFDRFVHALPQGALLVTTTYHLAVAALVLSLAGGAVNAGSAGGAVNAG